MHRGTDGNIHDALYRNSHSSLHQFDCILTNLGQTTNRKYHKSKPASETISEAYLVESVRWRVLGFVFSKLLAHEANRSRDKVITRHSSDAVFGGSSTVLAWKKMAMVMHDQSHQFAILVA